MWTLPSDIIANKTESRYARVCLHDSSQCTLRILGHRIGFIKNDDFVRRTWVCFSVRCDGLCTGCLACKIFDFFADNGDSSLI